MRIALAGWHYPHRNLLENVCFFSEAGFEAFSALGSELIAWVEDESRAEALACELKARALPFTVHYAFPKVADEKQLSDFRAGIRALEAWQRKYGAIEVLSFDVWVERASVLPMLQWVLDRFDGLGVKIACEDFPVDAMQLQMLRGVLYGENYGLLIDLGHMNLRMSDAGYPKAAFVHNMGEGLPDFLPGDNSPEAFFRALEIKPLPIFEMHVHNNDGTADRHAPLDAGTADFGGIFRAMADLPLDPNLILTIETVPGLHGFKGSAADREILRCKALLEAHLRDARLR